MATKEIKTHTCPECGFTDECSIELSYQVTHYCRNCYCKWNDKGVITHGSKHNDK